jgi:hypothetical protein
MPSTASLLYVIGDLLPAGARGAQEREEGCGLEVLGGVVHSSSIEHMFVMVVDPLTPTGQIVA